MQSALAELFSRYINLSEAERASLARLEGQDRTFRRGNVVIRDGEAPRELYVVRAGWLHSSAMLGNGSRQITRFHFRGDIVGLPWLAFADSPEAVTAVTEVTLSPFSREGLAQLIADHPRLGALILTLNVAYRVALADRLATIGRTPARARVGGLLCEIFARMGQSGALREQSIQLPLTQEEIGDATGLTAVHVNRMMRGLAEDGIIERRNGHIRLLDEDRLIAEANFVDRSRIDAGWLPPPR